MTLGDVGWDSRPVGGWTDDLYFLTVDLTPEVYTAAFGAHTFLRGTYKYMRHSGGGAPAEPIEVAGIICRVDEWPNELLERPGQPGSCVLFDPAYIIPSQVPGGPGAHLCAQQAAGQVQLRFSLWKACDEIRFPFLCTSPT